MYPKYYHLNKHGINIKKLLMRELTSFSEIQGAVTLTAHLNLERPHFKCSIIP